MINIGEVLLNLWNSSGFAAIFASVICTPSEITDFFGIVYIQNSY